ncbi:MAG: hypothetical protein QM758_10710 [Armatimonas sp.]
MTFGFEGRFSRRRAMLAGAMLFSALVMAAVSGCGGGGDGGTTNPTPDPTRTVPLTGQIIDVGNNLPVPGAIVAFNGAQAITDANGNFSVPSAPTTGSSNVSVVGPNDASGLPAYHSTVVYNNHIYNSGSFPIGATSGNTTVSVGQVFIANLSYPPFPPDFD